MPFDPLNPFGPPPVDPSLDPALPYMVPPAGTDPSFDDLFNSSVVGANQPEQPPLDQPEPAYPEDAFQASVVEPLRGRYFGSPDFDPTPMGQDPSQYSLGGGVLGDEQPVEPPPTLEPDEFATPQAVPQQYAAEAYQDPFGGAADLGQRAPEPFLDAEHGGALEYRSLDEEQARRDAMSDEERIEDDIDRERRRAELGQRLKDEADKNRQLKLDEAENDMLESRRVARQERERIAADAIRMAEEPDINIGQAIAGIIAGALSGFINPTGPNSGVAMVNAMVAKNRTAKQTQIDERRRLLGESIEDAQADYEEEVKKTIAGHEIAIQGITAQQAKMDPNGTAVRQYEIAKQAHRAEQAKTAQAYEDRSAKQFYEAKEFERAEQKSAIEFEKHEAEKAKAEARARNAGAVSKQKQLERAQARYDANDSTIDKDKYPTTQAWIAAGMPQRNAPRATPESGSEVSKRGVGGVKVRNPDGSTAPLLVGGGTEARDAVANTVAGRNAMQKAIKDSKELRKEGGVEWWDNLQKAQQAQLTRAYAAVYGLRQTTKDEVEEAKASAGAHFRGFKDPTEALDQLSRNVDVWATEQITAQQDQETAVSGQKIKFESYDLPEEKKGAAKSSLVPKSGEDAGISVDKEKVRDELAGDISKKMRGRYSPEQILQMVRDPTRGGTASTSEIKDALDISEYYQPRFAKRLRKAKEDAIADDIGTAVPRAEFELQEQITTLQYEVNDLVDDMEDWDAGDREIYQGKKAELRSKKTELRKLQKAAK